MSFRLLESHITKTNCFDKITFQGISFSGKSQCSSICNTDFDCQWGQVCENGMCTKNDEVHWTCDGAFNEPHETCKKKPKKDGKKLYRNVNYPNGRRGSPP